MIVIKLQNLGTDRISGSNFQISKGFKVVMADPEALALAYLATQVRDPSFFVYLFA